MGKFEGGELEKLVDLPDTSSLLNNHVFFLLIFLFLPQHSHICERVTQFCFLVYLYVTMRSSKYNIVISGYGVKGILNSDSLLFKIQNNQMNGVS